MWQRNFALSISTIVLSAGLHCTEIYRLNITDPDLSNLAVTLSGLFQDQYLYQPHLLAYDTSTGWIFIWRGLLRFAHLLSCFAWQFQKVLTHSGDTGFLVNITYLKWQGVVIVFKCNSNKRSNLYSRLNLMWTIQCYVFAPFPVFPISCVNGARLTWQGGCKDHFQYFMDHEHSV